MQPAPAGDRGARPPARPSSTAMPSTTSGCCAQRDFVVMRRGERFRVGAAVCSLAELQAKAARERRLLAHRRLAPFRSEHDLGRVDVHHDEAGRVGGTHR